MQTNLALKLEKRYTYKDYMTWNDNQYWELINGVAYQMAPPVTKHQDISRELLLAFGKYLEGKTCRVFHQPFGVRLPLENEPDEYIINAILPDIVVVCDKKKLDDAGCRGAPDLIIEILSPSTSKRDIKEKYKLYEIAGVKEYWIVEPHSNFIQVYKLEDNKYGKAEIYINEDKIKVGIFPELEIDLKLVFREYE
jgi:Uma2 family endonuclease